MFCGSDSYSCKYSDKLSLYYRRGRTSFSGYGALEAAMIQICGMVLRLYRSNMWSSKEKRKINPYT